MEVILGIGGYILEADRSNPWSLIMNGAVGGALLFKDKPMYGEGVSAYLDFLARYHVNSIYAIQFGPALIVNFMLPSITVDINLKIGLAF